MSWDLRLFQFVNQGLACPLLDGLLAAVSLSATPVPMLVVLCGLAWRRKREGTALLLVFVLSTLLSVGLQLLLGRERPAGARLVQPAPAFPSFPSGHAAGAFALATLSALFWPRRQWLPFLGASLVALSRVYLGHHYPSDVLAGAIVGSACAATLYGLLCAGPNPLRPRWAWLLWAQAAVVLLASLAASLGLIRFGLLGHPGADKALHFFLFGLLALFAAAWWPRRPAWQVVTALGLLALAEELSQSLVPGRSADPWDLLAGLAGTMLFAWLSRRLYRSGPCQRLKARTRVTATIPPARR